MNRPAIVSLIIAFAGILLLDGCGGGKDPAKVPADYRTVTLDGVSIKAPADWATTKTSAGRDVAISVLPAGGDGRTPPYIGLSIERSAGSGYLDDVVKVSRLIAERNNGAIDTKDIDLSGAKRAVRTVARVPSHDGRRASRTVAVAAVRSDGVIVNVNASVLQGGEDQLASDAVVDSLKLGGG